MMYHRLAKIAPSDLNVIAIKYGLWMLAGFMSFFLLMYFLGLAHYSQLRLFNGFIQLYFLYKSIETYYRWHPENSDNYLYGVVEGIKVSAIGVVGFAVFMTIFLSLHPELMNEIRSNSLMSDYLNPFTANLFILTEGLVVSIIISYILTRILEVIRKKAKKIITV